MKRHPHVVVYENIYEMFHYRGIKDAPAKKDSKSFNEEFLTTGFKSIKAKNKRNEYVLFIITQENSGYETKSADAMALINKQIRATGAEISELIFITSKPIGSHLAKTFAKFEVENPQIHLELHSYEMFISVKPKHVSYDEHIIMKPEEVQELLNFMNINIGANPRIFTTDPAVVWIGGREGDMIKIRRRSETAGQAYYYRLVVRPTKKLEEVEEQE